MQSKGDFQQGKNFRAYKWFTAMVIVLCAISLARGQQNATDDDSGDGRDRGQYAIGLWGDLPYSDVQALTGIPNLIADMNKQ
jgi:hypothetical protein